MKHCVTRAQARPLLYLSFPKTHPRKRRHPAYQQGDLDGLCGMYSLVNATNQLRGPFTEDQSTELLKELASTLDQQWSLFEAMLYGINGYQLTHLINHVLIPRYQLLCKKPFHRQPTACAELVWTAMMEWTRTGGLIILGTEEHWTVIEKATRNTLHLRDSSCMKWLRKRDALLHIKPSKRLRPQHLYFIKRQEDAP